MATRTVGPGKDYSTIASAILACNDNPASRAAMDIVLVDPGTYNEVLDFQSLSGGWSIPCIVRAADPTNRPVITSTGAAQAVIGGGTYRGTSGGEITLEDLIFSGWTNASNGVCYIGVVGAVIRRCKFTGNTNRICIRWIGSSASRLGIVDSCEFETSGSPGTGANGLILAWGSLTVVKNCKAVCPTNVQFLYEPSSGPGFVEHNSILGTWNTSNTAAILMVGSCRGNLIKNLGSGTYGIYNWGGTNTENFCNGTFSSRFTGTDGGSNVSTDPLFTNTGTGDLTLQSTSPAIGSLSRSANTLLDILGNSRNDPTDAGAYMYISASPWSDFDADTYPKVSGDFTINRNMNLSGHWKKRSGLAISSNGANAVEQVSFSLGIPGPATLRGRTKPYSTTSNSTAPNTPTTQSF
jgi:hypothetical protein